jgi:hypothetical protein
MKITSLVLSLLLFMIIFHSCDDQEIDQEKPSIDVSIVDAFPVNCDTLYFGESFVLRIQLIDNALLGTFSIDIHNNFDHHSHTTEVSTCTMEPVREAVNPFVAIQDFEIPEGLNEYTTNITIDIPEQNSNGKYDEGEYHFFISLVDNEGWSSQKGLSIKMLYR